MTSSDYLDVGYAFCVGMILAAIAGIATYILFFYKSSRPVNKKNVLEKKHAKRTKDREKNPIRVAIIGAGVGGSSASYFLQDLLGKGADIHVFSADKVGGRTAVVEVDRRMYEEGASVLHKDNLYMAGFAHKFGLTEVTVSSDGNMGLFDGYKFLYRSSSFGLWTKLTMLWRYGLLLFKMQSKVSKMLDGFANIYSAQQKGQSFGTVPAMLAAMGSDSHRLTQITASEHFLSELKWSKRLVDELVTAAATVNYGQTCSINAFVAMVSLAGVQSGSLWSVLGGNYNIPEKCLKESGAQFHPACVKSVTKGSGIDGASKYTLSYSDLATGVVETGDFDAVVLAAPLYNCGIEFKGFDRDVYTKTSLQPYHQTIATFVKGVLNPKYFGEQAVNQDFPISILGIAEKNEDVPINSAEVKVPDDVTEKDQGEYLQPLTVEPTRIWKVFSNALLSDDDLSRIFTHFDSKVAKPWRAYPEYQPPQQFTPFVLDDSRLFYVNCIEKAASAMEMSVIAAKNCALLLDESFESR